MHLSPPSEGWHQHYFSLPGLNLAGERGSVAEGRRERFGNR